MDYQDASGEWIGFDADLAKAFAESLPGLFCALLPKKDGLSYFCPFGHRVNHEYGAEKGRDAMNTTIYQNIATRTAGDIYIGVVGPVRTGKSTFYAVDEPHGEGRAVGQLHLGRLLRDELGLRRHDGPAGTALGQLIPGPLFTVYIFNVGNYLGFHEALASLRTTPPGW